MRIFKALLIYLFSIIAINNTFAEFISAKDVFASDNYYNLQISPDASLISTIYRDNKTHRLVLINRESNEVYHEINLGFDTSINSYHWLESDTLLFDIEYKNQERILIGKVKDKKVELKALQTRGYFVHDFPDDPSSILFAKRVSHIYTGNVWYDLYKIKIKDFVESNFDNAIHIKHDDESVDTYSYDPISKKIVTVTYDEDTETNHLKTLPLSGRSWETIVSVKVGDYKVKYVSILPNNRVALLSNVETDKVALQAYNTISKSFEEVIFEHPKYDLTGAQFSEKGQLTSVRFLEHGVTSWKFFDPVEGELNKRLSNTFPNKEYFTVDSSLDGAFGIIKVQGSDLPGDYFVFDRKNLTLNRLVAAKPDVVAHNFQISQRLKVTSKDGVEIEALLTTPTRQADISTLLVMPHGGPIGVRDDDGFNPQVQYFVSRGFSVLRVNFRGSEGFGKKFQDQGVGEFGELIEEDISAAVNYVLNKQSFKNVCSMGASYGGYSAVMLAIKHPELYKCVIASFGIYDLPLIFNADSHFAQEKNREPLEKVLGKYRSELADVSPIYFAEKLKAPILLIGGIEDETAVFEHSHRFEYVLKKLGHSVQSFNYKDTGHGHRLWSGDWHQHAVSFEFLNRELNLKLMSGKGLSESSKQALADDLYIIGEYFYEGDWIEQDEKRAVDYYQRAAKLNHPEAIYNMAKLYLEGEYVDKDVTKGLEYLTKARDLNVPEAYSQLGVLYMEGQHVALDWAKAKENIETALNLDATPKHYFLLARFDCTAPGEYQNISRCLKALDLKRFKLESKNSYNRAKWELRHVAPWIIAETQLTPEQRTTFEDILKEAYSLNELLAEMHSVKIGQFKYEEGIGYGNDDQYHLVGRDIVTTENESDEENELYFGIRFKLEIPGLDERRDRVAVAGRWIRETTDNKKEYVRAAVLYGSPREEWSFLLPVDDFEKGSKMTLEVFDLKGKLMAKETFVEQKLTANTSSKESAVEVE